MAKANTKTVTKPKKVEAPALQLDEFESASIFEVEYHISCVAETFSAVEGHKSVTEDLGYRQIVLAVPGRKLDADGSFSTRDVTQLIYDQVLVPEFEGHEMIKLRISRINKICPSSGHAFIMV